MSSVILRKWKTIRPMSSYTCIWGAALETHDGLCFAGGKAGHKCSFRPMQLPLSRIIWCLRCEAASFGPTETFPSQRCVAYWKVKWLATALFVISLRITFDEICYRRLNCRLKVLDIYRSAISHQSSPRSDQRPHPVFLAHPTLLCIKLAKKFPVVCFLAAPSDNFNKYKR